MVAGFVVCYAWSRGVQYLPRFMRVSRFLVPIALCLVFLASVGCVSFCFAMFAKELLFVGSAFFGGMALSVASIARFCVSEYGAHAQAQAHTLAATCPCMQTRAS